MSGQVSVAEKLASLTFLHDPVQLWVSGGGGPPERAVVFLHGSGDSGEGLLSWIKGLAPRLGNGTIVIFPSAPHRPYSLLGGQLSRVWHDRRQLHIEGWEDTEGIAAMAQQMSSFIERVAELTGLPRNKLALGGFSQGGHMALHGVYGHGIEVGCCFALSSFLCRDSITKGPLLSTDTPLRLSTGSTDSMVASSWVEDTAARLRGLGVEVEWEEREDLAHDMEREQIDDLLRWLENRL